VAPTAREASGTVFRDNRTMLDAPVALEPLLAAVRARSTGIGSHIHGELHWRTVGANGFWLAEPLDDADTLVIFLFALLHDSMRENDSIDPEHGPRAAAFAVGLHAEGLLGTTPAQLETLRYACFEHTNGLVSADPTIGVCWDADRLDLPRVGIEPDPARFSTERAHEGPPELGEVPDWPDFARRAGRGRAQQPLPRSSP
jgi:uncharacterized protein